MTLEQQIVASAAKYHLVLHARLCRMWGAPEDRYAECGLCGALTVAGLGVRDIHHAADCLVALAMELWEKRRAS